MKPSVHADTDLISSSSKNHDPEDEDHAEPDLPDDRGMRLDLVQQGGQKAPLTHGAGSGRGNRRQRQSPRPRGHDMLEQPQHLNLWTGIISNVPGGVTGAPTSPDWTCHY